MNPADISPKILSKRFHALSQNGQLFHVNLCSLFESDEEVSSRLEE